MLGLKAAVIADTCCCSLHIHRVVFSFNLLHLLVYLNKTEMPCLKTLHFGQAVYCSYVPFQQWTLLADWSYEERRSAFYEVRTEFFTCLMHFSVLFAADKITLGQVFLVLLHYSPVSIIPPMIRAHFHLKTSLCRRTSGRSVGISEQSSGVAEWPALGILVELWMESSCGLFVLPFTSIGCC